MEILQAAIGLVMLIVGRQFYAFFVGGVGFLVSAVILEQFFGPFVGWDAIWIPGVVALLLGGVTFELGRWMAFLASSASGAFVIYVLPQVLGFEGAPTWPYLVLGGLIFLIATVVVFDFAMVIISTLTGVSLIVPVLSGGTFPPAALYLLLCFIGVITQSVLLRYGNRSPD